MAEGGAPLCPAGHLPHLAEGRCPASIKITIAATPRCHDRLARRLSLGLHGDGGEESRCGSIARRSGRAIGEKDQLGSPCRKAVLFSESSYFVRLVVVYGQFVVFIHCFLPFATFLALAPPRPLRGARINFPGLERVYQLEIAKGLRRKSAAFFAAMLPTEPRTAGQHG
jgi:hypothetical protein